MSDVDVRPAWSGSDPVIWSQRSVGGAGVLAPVGELDADLADELERRLTHLVESTDGPTVLIDMVHVDFIDAGCVGVILRARAEARRRNRTLCVQGLHGLPARVFDALGLRGALVCPTPADERVGGPGER
jgi:anti-anti-sigma factor